MKNLKKIILLFLIPVFSFAFSQKNDFQFYKDIKTNTVGLKYFFIDDDIESHSQRYLEDLRIFDKKKEVPYKIIKEKDIIQNSKKEINLDKNTKDGKYFILDLKKKDPERYLNSVCVKTKSKDFRRAVDVWGGDFKNGPFFSLNINGQKKDLIYSLPEKTKECFDFKFSNYKYLKIAFEGDEGDFNPDGFYRIEENTNIIKGDKEKVEILGTELDNEGNNQSIIFDLKKNNLFFDQLELKFFDKRFRRKYILYSSDSKDAELLKDNKRFDKNKNYWVKVSEGDLIKESYTGDPVLNLSENKRYYRLDILNGDNQKLKFDFAVFEKFKKKIYFKSDSNNLKVYYGSKRVGKPNYDFVIGDIKNAKKVKLSEEKINKDYVKEKKGIFDTNTWLIYLMVGVVVFILIFFVYKIIKEEKNKTKKDEIQI